MQRRWQEPLAGAEPPQWIREMIEYYHRTGTCRAEGVRRLLGDPTRGVDGDPQSGLASWLARKDMPED